MVRKWPWKLACASLLTTVLAACGGGSATEAPATNANRVTITIESWRSDDQKVWTEQIIPLFEKSNPNIHVEFRPTAPTEYNAALNSKLEAGTAGDLITCRPFDVSLGLYTAGHLAPLNDLQGVAHFSDVAKSAWQTDDGKTLFCLPMASVIHGFIYNKTIFNELGLSEPKTVAEFFAVLDKIKQDGRYTPLVMGTAEQWEAATMGFQNIGPNYWLGENGRKALIDGSTKLTDAAYVSTFKDLERWRDYLPEGFEAVKYADAQILFASGRGAIYPAGSWDIAYFNQNAKFELGAFKAPVVNANDQCFISDHTDIGIGINAKTTHMAEARTFLEWMTGPEFAGEFSNALPGFFSLSDYPVTLKNPLAQTFVDWRKQCQSTIRNSYQILSRGEPNLENELWRTSVGVINGTFAPEAAAQDLQKGLDNWYKKP
ncbi:ABC transporter substrate-binding protein [Herpetosiphon llansteffanensis]|uniref:ABC transporter substrate-binding protein n=1 Tax=Herpetosiphon llansteffanensis TaxID=2094568 RepID=UPI000D7CBBF1|nr:ABC transporter substrate-binding protein [Herpetosiphon llansteffanensis]